MILMRNLDHNLVLILFVMKKRSIREEFVNFLIQAPRGPYLRIANAISAM